MAMVFHCEHCNRRIEAAESSGGKWAKCPTCHNKIYVPRPQTEEELKLAPIDENEYSKQKELLDETFQLTQDILQERELPEEQVEVPDSISDISDKDLTNNIIMYLRQMADGNLGGAERITKAISPFGLQAIQILDQIAVSEMPEPELADIPPQVLSGLIRTLRNKIS